MKKRLLSTMLALCLVLTILPLNALATDEPPVETETGAELQEEEATTPENPTPLTPIEVTEDEQTTTPDSGGTSELGNPSEDATNSQLSGSDSGNEQDEPMILSETKESARTSITDPGLTASGTCGDNATWTLNTYTGVLTISGSGRMTKGQWSAYETIVKTIVIQDGITSIGEWAFNGFKNLTDVTIPNSVTTIEMGAFADCSSIDNITIPNSVVNIEHSAFRACVSLHNVDIPNSVTNLGMQAFSSCRNLTSVTIPGSINTIKSSTFYSCESLMDVLISDGVETIEDMAFGYCGFESIHIPNSVTRIKGHAFGFCRNLKSIILPNSVTNIENDNGGAFWTCSGLISVVLPENLPELCIGLFAGCDHLTNVYIPKAAKNIRTSAFVDCDGLTDIYYEGNEEDWKAITIGLNNESLEKATIHYNSKPEDVPMPQDYRVYRNGGYETFDVSLEECMRKTASTQYNPQLAHMLIAMCNSVDNQFDINNTFRNFDFAEANTKTNYSMMNGIFLGYGMAKKQVNDKTLVLIVARGSKDVQEWISNLADFKPNIKGQHSGFSDAANGLYKQVVSLLGTSDFSNTEFVITGFSRGAAVANILAARLVDEGVSLKDVYAYTFACPDTVASISNSIKENYPCIFNIGNANDLVSWAPGGVIGFVDSLFWNKYGKSLWYSENWDDYENLEMGFDAHNQVKYLDYLRSERPESIFKFRSDAKSALNNADIKRLQTKLWNNLKKVVTFLAFHCPVDVEIRTATGELVGTVIDNIPNEVMTDKIHIAVDGDQKEIYLFDDAEYIVRLTGTDEGVMEYIVRNIEVDTWNILEEKTFANIALTKNKRMVSYINIDGTDNEFGTDVPNVRLLVLNEEETPVKEVLPDGNGTEIPLKNNGDGTGNNTNNGSSNKPGSSQTGNTKNDTSTIMGSNNTQNGASSNEDAMHSNKSPSTGDSISTMWLYLAGVLTVIILISIIRKRFEDY